MRVGTRPDKIALLKNVGLFAGLGKRQLAVVARNADEVSVDAGRVVARQGGLGREFLLILQGAARVERDGKLIARLEAGDFFGEMALIDGKPRSASVVTETPSSLLVMHSRSFDLLLETVPGLRKKILVGLCERLRQADTALASMN